MASKIRKPKALTSGEKCRIGAEAHMALTARNKCGGSHDSDCRHKSRAEKKRMLRREEW